MTVFRYRLNGSATSSFLTVQTMDINVNLDPKWFRYPGVDMTYSIVIGPTVTSSHCCITDFYSDITSQSFMAGYIFLVILIYNAM